MRLLDNDFVEKYATEDWGVNAHGWHAKIITLPTGDYIAMKPPTGKFWRGDVPEVETEATAS